MRGARGDPNSDRAHRDGQPAPPQSPRGGEACGLHFFVYDGEPVVRCLLARLEERGWARGREEALVGAEQHGLHGARVAAAEDHKRPRPRPVPALLARIQSQSKGTPIPGPSGA